jgi:hypothetical protein
MSFTPAQQRGYFQNALVDITKSDSIPASQFSNDFQQVLTSFGFDSTASVTLTVPIKLIPNASNPEINLCDQFKAQLPEVNAPSFNGVINLVVQLAPDSPLGGGIPAYYAINWVGSNGGAYDDFSLFPSGLKSGAKSITLNVSYDTSQIASAATAPIIAQLHYYTDVGADTYADLMPRGIVAPITAKSCRSASFQCNLVNGGSVFNGTNTDFRWVGMLMTNNCYQVNAQIGRPSYYCDLSVFAPQTFNYGQV